MRSVPMAWFVAAMWLVPGSGVAQAEIRAELLESKAVWKHPAHPAETDLIRFRGTEGRSSGWGGLRRRGANGKVRCGSAPRTICSTA